MFVKGIMKPYYKCILADKDDTLQTLLDKFIKNDVQGMPVIDNEKFIGMISKQIIYQAYFESNNTDKETFLSETKAKDVAKYKDLHIKDDAVFEKTLPSFYGFPILAVVNDNMKFLGLVTRVDVIEQFESAFGVHQKGIRISFTSLESEGRIARLADVIKQTHSNVISLATFDETDKLVRRIVLKLDKVENINKFTTRLEKAGFRVLDIKEM